MPLALISAMEEAQIFRMWLPQPLGGPELSIAEFVRVVEALSYMDGSVGWCAGLGAAYSRFAAYLPEAVANRIFDGNIMAGSLAPTGRGMKVKGGYRVTGRWGWGSGIMHSNWILVTFLTQVGDEPILVNGKPEMRLGFLPKSQDVEIIDTWNVGGMRGTGSHDYALSDVFIPDEYTLEGLDPPSRHPGSLYAVFAEFGLSVRDCCCAAWDRPGIVRCFPQSCQGQDPSQRFGLTARQTDCAGHGWAISRASAKRSGVLLCDRSKYAALGQKRRSR